MTRLLPSAVVAILFSLGMLVIDEACAAGRVEKRIYKKTPQAALEIHLHFPPGWKPSDKRPAIVFFFGGGWKNGTVNQFATQAAYLAERGLVAARADYRVLSRHKTKADKCVEDSKSAVRYLREHAESLGIDPDRIVASGGSAGGHTAAATATAPGFEAKGENHKISSKPNLLVLFNPAMAVSSLGDRFGSDELAKNASPADNVKKDTPASIIFFGTDDRLIEGSKLFAKRAEKLGVTSEIWTAKDQKHGFFNKSPWRESTLLLTDRFLVKHGYLKGEPTVKAPENAVMTRLAK